MEIKAFNRSVCIIAVVLCNRISFFVWIDMKLFITNHNNNLRLLLRLTRMAAERGRERQNTRDCFGLLLPLNDVLIIATLKWQPENFLPVALNRSDWNNLKIAMTFSGHSRWMVLGFHKEMTHTTNLTRTTLMTGAKLNLRDSLKVRFVRVSASEIELNGNVFQFCFLSCQLSEC